MKDREPSGGLEKGRKTKGCPADSRCSFQMHDNGGLLTSIHNLIFFISKYLTMISVYIESYMFSDEQQNYG